MRAPEQDTAMGGSADRFPRTRHSAIVALRSSDAETRRQAFDALTAAYWKPLYKYARMRWHSSNEDAKELTQGFLARAFEARYFDSYDPARASFRTFVRVCFERFVANEHERSSRAKRGGEAVAIDLDALDPGDLARDGEHDAYFEQEWNRALFEAAIARFAAHCAAHGKERHYAIFERYDLREHAPHERPSYESLASEFDTSATQITNHLAWSRREFKNALLAELRSTCIDEDDFEAQARALLGWKPA